MEQISADTLEEFARDESISIPGGFRERLETLLISKAVSEERQKNRNLRIAAASVAVAVVASLLIILDTERNPVDTFTDPEQAYAELNRSFRYIASKINEGVEISSNAEETIIRNLDIFNR